METGNNKVSLSLQSSFVECPLNKQNKKRKKESTNCTACLVCVVYVLSFEIENSVYR